MNDETENKMKYYPVATTIGAEKRVMAEIDARLSDFGSLKELQGELGNILSASHVRGYVVVESNAKYVVENVVGTNKLNPISKMKGVKYVLDAMDYDSVKEWMRERSPLEGINIGALVEIMKGAFKGERAIVTNLQTKQGLAIIELMDAAIPLSLKLSGKEIRCMT